METPRWGVPLKFLQQQLLGSPVEVCLLALRGQRPRLWSQSPAPESDQYECSRCLCKVPLATSAVWSTVSLLWFLLDT